jgi:hypothetical protein
LKNELCYGAYDFDVEANRSFAPEWALQGNETDTERLPAFFELSANAEENTPSAISPERSILHLGTRLAADVLRQKRQAELIVTLRRELHAHSSR